MPSRMVCPVGMRGREGLKITQWVMRHLRCAVGNEMPSGDDMPGGVMRCLVEMICLVGDEVPCGIICPVGDEMPCDIICLPVGDETRNGDNMHGW